MEAKKRKLNVKEIESVKNCLCSLVISMRRVPLILSFGVLISAE